MCNFIQKRIGMLSNTKIPTIIIPILLGLFLLAAWFGYKHLDIVDIDPIQAFPKNTTFVLEIPDPTSFFENLNEENAFWADLISDIKTKELNNLFNELFSQGAENEKLSLFLRQPFYLSLVKNEENKTDFLLVTKQNGFSLESLNSKLFSKIENLEYSKPENDSSFSKLKMDASLCFLTQSKGLIFISSGEKNIQNSLDQITNENDFIKSADFNQLKMTRGKRADAYLYIDYTNANDFFRNQLKETSLSQLKLSSFANFSVLDIILKKDELLLNGYTSAHDSLNQYLTTFQNQKGQKSQLAISLPYSTKSFISINLSDYHAFIEKQIELAKLENSKIAIDKMINRNSSDITEHWWAGEMALVIDENQREYAVFTAKSGREAFRLLADIAHQSQPSIITENYRELKIKEINSAHFLKSQFGTLFSGFNEVFFCVIDEAVIFSKSIPDLKNYIDALILGNNLSKNEAYIEFSDNLSDDAIIRVYSKTLQPNHPLFDVFSENGAAFLKDYSESIKHIQGIGIQISNKNNLFYTGLFFSHGTNRIEKSSAWQIELDAPIAVGPFLVKNHTTNGNNILVQDEFNTLYFFNEMGDIIWSQQLKEIIKSQIFSVDYYKNRKWQYVFNTANYLYLIDINGNAVGNYPIQLNSEATNGLQILDYANKKDYRLFIACQNGELYNYEINGRLLKGWQPDNTRKKISKPINHLITNNKDYLIAEAENGNIIMTDRRGNKRMEVRTSFTNALGSDVYVNRTNRSKGMMLTTDTEGTLVYIPATGSVNKTSFGKMSEKHYFLYADFTGNTEMDFIYLDNNKLRIFDKFKNILLSYDFNNPITLKPQVFTYKNKTIVGIVDQIEKQLYLFDKNGLLADKMHKGSTSFVVGKLAHKGAPCLLIGLDKSIYNYPLDSF